MKKSERKRLRKVRNFLENPIEKELLDLENNGIYWKTLTKFVDEKTVKGILEARLLISELIAEIDIAIEKAPEIFIHY